jgi:S1-C subfamily serine protease
MTELSDFSGSLAEVTARVAPSVVAVHGGRCDTSSGVVWAKDLVVTAAHAIERERSLEVTHAGGRTPATLVGADAASNLAVLRVEAELSPPVFARADALRLGEVALTLSRGARGARVRLGIVSRLGGEWKLGGGTRVGHYIEPDVAPEPGLSGSALVNAAGELVGVNAAGLVRGSLVTLPAETVAQLVEAMTRHGRVRRARLGVGLERVELPRIQQERLGRRRALMVISVLEGSPADRGGLLLGDVILSVQGQAVERVEELQSALGESAIDVALEVGLLRAGVEQRVTLTPEAR